MAEILVKAVDYTHADPVKDTKGSYKRGMPVVVMPDGHQWGAEERLPKFAVLKFPGVAVEKLEKYTWADRDVLTNEVTRRRSWLLQWATLPLAARQKLQANGELVIAAGAYAGPRDYTWAQIRAFLLNQKTGLTETADLA